jgi:hypothetical protein
MCQPLPPFFFSSTFPQIKDYHNLIEHISCVLRPGGLVEILENDITVYDLNHQPIPVDTLSLEPPWLARWFAFMRMAVRGRGGDVGAAAHLHQWMCEHGDFEDIVYKEYWVPTSPFLVGNDEASDWWRSVGEVIRQDAYVRLFTSYN